MYTRVFKRLFDLLFSTIVFVVLFPVFLLVVILLYLTNQGKPFFFQLRPGKNGKLFRIVKFKTMNEKWDMEGKPLPDADRLTPIGALVRKTSFDEFPQLLNVIKGNMSLIGPRPLLPEYMQLYSKEQLRRHEVKPGITGWAQVNGRNNISWNQKFKLDVWYVDHISFWLDLRIIALTILKVLKSDDINADGQATMSKFDGK